MARSESTIEIDRPPAVVFPWLVEPEKRLRWVVGLAASEPLDERRYRETMEAGGRRIEVTSTVVRLEEPTAVDVEMRGGGVSARGCTRLDEAGAGTRVTSSLELELGGLLRFASGIAGRQAQQSLERSLRRLKELVEAEPRGRAEPEATA
jgi:carbon monoxide dehydrogenase subunit G